MREADDQAFQQASHKEHNCHHLADYDDDTYPWSNTDRGELTTQRTCSGEEQQLWQALELPTSRIGHERKPNKPTLPNTAERLTIFR
jgi:hypothetical protein